MLPALLGKDPVGREELILEGIGAKTILRSGDRVYSPYPGHSVAPNTGIELGNSLKPSFTI